MSSAKVSIIIPALNDAGELKRLLPELQDFRTEGHEVIVVDGGSIDGTLSVARPLSDRLLMTGAGRGRQMNLGVENARHDLVLFLHADSQFPGNGIHEILRVMNEGDHHWGRFDISLDGKAGIYRLIALLMNIRSRITKVATGDQGIFVRKSLFLSVGGYEDIPLMEDVAISKTLREHSSPYCLDSRIITSARRWQQNGVLATIIQMWVLRLAYYLGADPAALAQQYYSSNTDKQSIDTRD